MTWPRSSQWKKWSLGGGSKNISENWYLSWYLPRNFPLIFLFYLATFKTVVHSPVVGNVIMISKNVKTFSLWNIWYVGLWKRSLLACFFVAVRGIYILRHYNKRDYIKQDKNKLCIKLYNIILFVARICWSTKFDQPVFWTVILDGWHSSKKSYLLVSVNIMAGAESKINLMRY